MPREGATRKPTQGQFWHADHIVPVVSIKYLVCHCSCVDGELLRLGGVLVRLGRGSCCSVCTFHRQYGAAQSVSQSVTQQPFYQRSIRIRHFLEERSLSDADQSCAVNRVSSHPPSWSHGSSDRGRSAGTMLRTSAHALTVVCAA